MTPQRDPMQHPTSRSTSLRRRLVALTLGTALLATACGTSTEIGGTAGGDTADVGAVAVAQAGSSSAAAAQGGPITWLELVDPSGQGARQGAQNDLASAAEQASRDAQQLDSCPLLADSTFVASVAGSRTDLPSTEATNVTCAWRYPGMSFSLKIERAREVDTVNHSGRAYNIDVEPTVTPQSGPGTNAVLLSDTAFVDLGSEPFDYAYFFVLGDEAVTLRSTGLGMRPDAWRTMADEVAANLGAGNGGLAAAEALEAASQVEVDQVELGPVDPCSYLSIEQAAELMGVPGTPLTVAVIARGSAQSCAWEAPDGRLLTIFGRTNDDRGPDFYLTGSADDVTDRIGVPAADEGWRTIAFLPGDIEGLDTWHTIEVGGNGLDNVTIAAVIVSRIQPPVRAS